MNCTNNFNLADKPDDYYLRKRPEMVDYIPKTAKKILDVGCGAGVFIQQLKQNGIIAEFWGVEIDESAAILAKNKTDKILIGDINKLIDELPGTYFDCIIFNDILEHIIDPFSILSKIKNKLSKNSVVVSSIPNVRYFRILKNLIVKKEWKYQESGILDKTHLRFFTEKSIRDMFVSLGYEILKIEGIGPAINRSWELKLLNFLSFGHLSDSKYPTFVCVARARNQLKES